MAGIIKVNQYQDFNGNTLFTSDGSGNLTTQNIMKPAFEAYLSANQDISDATNTKIQYDTEVLDTDNCYDNSTNYRFTPTVAGKYFVYVQNQALALTASKLNGSNNIIYKNGSEYKKTGMLFSNNYGRRASVSVTAIIDMNGTTDYLEGFAYIDATSGTVRVETGDPKGSYFGAYRIGS